MVKCEDPAGELRRTKQFADDVVASQPGVRSRSFLDDQGGSDIPYVFRLQDKGDSGSLEDRLERASVTSASVYSFFKQRIDSMFDESRSQMSYSNRRLSDNGLYKEGDEIMDEEKQQRINNTVQARIEKMFAEMAKSGDAATRKLKSGAQNSPSVNCNKFSVDYLGSVTLPEKITSLQGLQEPLRNLYFEYRRLKSEVGNVWASGTLEISAGGLKVQHRGGPDKSELEQLNPFPTIAVWAAVKFVCRRQASGEGMEFAFVPLIADPDAMDKGKLFRPLNASHHKIIIPAGVDLTDKETSFNHHSPLFAVVMRKFGVTRQLECHGFVCSCSEDAIVIAANLYQALITNMQARSRRRKNNKAGAPAPPVSKNGSDTRSIATPLKDVAPKPPSMAPPSPVKKMPRIIPEETVYKRAPPPPPAKLPPPVPVRPPRRKKSSSSNSEEGDPPATAKPSPPSPNAKKQHQHKPSTCKKLEITPRSRHNRSESEPCNGSATLLENQNVGVRRTVSDLHGYNSIQMAPDYHERGDILTKVAIPRSKSFLNAGGPLTRYNRRTSTGPHGGSRTGGGCGSPLGFNELFTEFRVQEGLNSMDDILDAIIDAEGMSFNDLKPIYKEFLLKLAVTLTKDELYQRSKIIMRKQRKKQNMRHNGSGCVKRKKSFSANGNGLKKVFRRSVSKLKSSKTRPSSFEFTSVLFPSSAPIRNSTKPRDLSLESTTTSTSSYSARNFHLQRQSSVKVGMSRALRLSRRLSVKKKKREGHVSSRATGTKRTKHASTSEDSDFFSMVRCGGTGNTRRDNTLHGGGGPNRSSSGYFSCSECSYDSESCTCTSADKCYCSMGKGKSKARSSSSIIPQKEEGSFSSCGCDTDSCVDSDKCYCTLNQSSHHHHKPPSTSKKSMQKLPATGSVFDQLKQRGFAVSDTSLSRAASPTTAWRKNEKRMVSTNNRKNEENNAGSIKSSKSLEFLQMSPGTRQAPMWNTRRTKSDDNPGQFNMRMNVYDPMVNNKSSYHLTSEFKTEQRHSSSDNLALDYDLFTTSSKSDEEENPGPQQLQKKVLVVSARDPRGRIIYMGASCRGEERGRRGNGGRSAANTSGSASSSSHYASARRRHGKGSSSAACEALSVKKSAEIAALFSDVKLNQTTDLIANGEDDNDSKDGSRIGDVFYNTMNNPAYYCASKPAKNYLGSNLENSLGYLP